MKRSFGLLLVGVASFAATDLASAQNVGPSTTTPPYVIPARAGVITKSILTTGDAVGGYRMVGIPDGAGALGSSGGFQLGTNFDLWLNHELGSTNGIARAHGSKGAFVSRYNINRTTLRVNSGRDHLQGTSSVMLWNGSSFVGGTTAMDRLCSADSPNQRSFYYNGVGTQNPIFLSGEETSPPFAADHGRAFAHVVGGPNANRSYQLPRLGRMAFENIVASPYSQPKTVVMLMDDAGRTTGVLREQICRGVFTPANCIDPPSELFMYVGTKTNMGSDIDRAGLNNGNFFGIRVVVNGAPVIGEHKEFVFSSSAPAVTSARFLALNYGNVANKTGVQLQDTAIGSKTTQFIRIEDGAWDPRAGKQNDFYFVTTGRLHTNPSSYLPSRLWRVRFDDIKRPELGGTITMLLSSSYFAGAGSTPDADPGFQMLDNIAIDQLGRIIMQEDVGGDNRLGRIWVYGIDSGALVKIANFDPAFFSGNAATNPNFLTIDEEASGIIDATHVLGTNWYLMTVQNHRSSADPELVQGGQIVAMYIDPAIAR